jgi:transcriptional regulator with XRE-family HTH domain
VTPQHRRELGYALWLRRTNAGLTQIELARQAKVPVARIRGAEEGKIFLNRAERNAIKGVLSE